MLLVTGQLYASAILAGIFVNGTIPLFYELTCEVCYPVAEGISGGLLSAQGNMAGLLIFIVFDIPNVGE